jgi:hypothetical protein
MVFARRSMRSMALSGTKMRRLVGKRRRGEKTSHRPALLLDAEIRCAADRAVRRLDAVTDQLGSAVGERAVTAPVRLPALC